jgi:hypothetical protein
MEAVDRSGYRSAKKILGNVKETRIHSPRLTI